MDARWLATVPAWAEGVHDADVSRLQTQGDLAETQPMEIGAIALAKRCSLWSVMSGRGPCSRQRMWL